MPHEYIRILEQQKTRNHLNYLHVLNQTSAEAKSRIITDLAHEGHLISKATLRTEGLEAYCGVLTQVESGSSSHGASYEPTLVVGTHCISKEQELKLVFMGFVLGQITAQGAKMAIGHIGTLSRSFWSSCPGVFSRSRM